MTLREGIARSIMDTLPEVRDVIDVTDHEAGENPYYT
jgi:Fe/S biogenesis protein NfuA